MTEAVIVIGMSTPGSSSGTVACMADGLPVPVVPVLGRDGDEGETMISDSFGKAKVSPSL
jgi:hypothetical protein